MGIFDILKPTKGNKQQEKPKAPSALEEKNVTEATDAPVTFEQSKQPTTAEPELIIEIEEEPVIEISVPDSSTDSIQIETPQKPSGLQRRIKNDIEKVEKPIIQIEDIKEEIEIKQEKTEAPQVVTAASFVPTLEMGDATTIRMKIKERIVKEATIGTDLDRTLIWTNNIQIHSSLNNGDFIEKLKADYGDKCCYSLNEGEVIIRKGTPNEKDNATEIFAGVWIAYSKGDILLPPPPIEDQARITIWDNIGEMLQDEYILQPGETDGNVYFIGREDPSRRSRVNHIVIPCKKEYMDISREQADILLRDGKFYIKSKFADPSYHNNNGPRTKILRFNNKNLQEEIRFRTIHEQKELKDKDIIYLSNSVRLRFELIKHL